MVGVGRHIPTVAEIKRAVAAEYGVTVADLDGPSRFRRHSQPRHAAMTLAHLLTRHSKEHISVMFGKHRNTAAWAIERTHRCRRDDAKLDRAMKRIALELVR
jgi:chromosomal replication initiation ATPase DnaA